MISLHWLRLRILRLTLRFDFFLSFYIFTRQLLKTLLYYFQFLSIVIRNSFVFLDRVGLRKEGALWKQGIRGWNTFLATETIKGIGPTRKAAFDLEIKEAKSRLWKEDYQYFIKRMPQNQQWRLYPLLKDECVFLDIETSGYYGDITVVGLFDGYESKMFVKGGNLDRDALIKELSKYKLIITFNGASFDLPVIEKYFQFKFSQVHIDLRHVCSKLGLVGGLKSIEKQMGISRPDEVQGVDGCAAVYLWQMWKSTRDQEYLRKLLMYNEEDIVNLKFIADRVIKQLWGKTYKTPE